MRPHPFLILLISITCTIRADEPNPSRSKARQNALTNLELQIESTGWGNANIKDLSAVLHSSCSELAVHFENEQLKAIEPIRVRYSEAGPITQYKRTEQGEVLVLLDSKNKLWSQHAYQIAHEFTHILCHYKKADRSNLWFEESICELASIFALRQMAKSWQTAPPFPNWKEYSKSLKVYSDDIIKKNTLQKTVSLRTWYQSHADELSKKATNRSLNGKVAVRLLPLFESHPDNWKAVYFLNAGVTTKKQSFTQYLKSWHQNCPIEHKPFVQQVGQKFGIKL